MPTRRVLLVFGLAFGFLMSAAAQDRMPSRMNTYTDEAPATGFRKENLFAGGGLGLGFGSYNFNIGLNPEIGYSLNRWLDVGAVVNFSYNSVSAGGYYDPYLSSKQFVYGGGVFGRAYVLPFLFLTAQPEFNWNSTQEKEESSGSRFNYSANAPSLLLGIGYGRRIVGESGFYIALMFDAISNVNSPYNDVYGHPLPIIRAGFDIYLHHSR
jgi:hypothetical protein